VAHPVQLPQAAVWNANDRISRLDLRSVEKERPVRDVPGARVELWQ
jgi:hypothetical protein